MRTARPLTIGRGTAATVQLGDAELSREHCRVELREGRLWIEDLGSTNGTLLGGQPIARAQLSLGDRVSLGHTSMQVVELSAAQKRAAELTAEHTHFVELLRHELERTRAGAQAAPLSLAILRAPSAAALEDCIKATRPRLGPRDRLGRYADDVLEALFVDADADAARARLAPLIDGQQGLLCGVSGYPGGAASAETLVARALEALGSCSPGDPLRLDAFFAGAGAGPAPTTRAGATGGLVAQSAVMQALLERVRRVARSSIPVLLRGETGSGKEEIARALHRGSSRRAGPLVVLDCAAIPESLIESVLFGHERGAFTGADRRRIGVFERADGGTVFLDEVGELSAAAQAALLRVLETQRLSRVGGGREIAVDVRVVAATHRDLKAMCDEGSFRSDLYYRLDAMTLVVPPLRERREEIAPLCRAFIARADQQHHCAVDNVQKEALELLEQHSWPGNVRELRNAIEHAVVLARSGTLGVEHLPERLLTCREGSPPKTRPTARQSPAPRSSTPEDELREGLRQRVRAYEAALLGETLRQHDWNKTAAAAALGLPVRTLGDRIKALDVRATDDPRAWRAALADAGRYLEGEQDAARPYRERVRAFEAALIGEALEACDGNRTRTAAMLAIPLRTLRNKLQAHGLG